MRSKSILFILLLMHTMLFGRPLLGASQDSHGIEVSWFLFVQAYDQGNLGQLLKAKPSLDSPKDEHASSYGLSSLSFSLATTYKGLIKSSAFKFALHRKIFLLICSFTL